MKRKAPISQDESSKRRKQESTDISSQDNDNEAQVHSIHAELSALKTREIADISGSIASIPHMTFAKRPIKLKNKTTIKPTNTNTSNTNVSSNNTSTSKSLSLPRPLPDTTLTSKKSQLEKAKSAARRSSFGQRGKRAKGSFEQGESVMPHESVRSETLYRHIDTELPEPHRARHLLVWCARRAAQGVPVQQDPKGKGKGKGKAGGLNAADSALVASVQDRIVRQLMDLTIDIPLYDISGGPFAADLGKTKGKGKKEALVEDPVNARNREVKERLAKAEERARDEDVMWSKVIQDYNSLQSTVLSTLPEPPLPPKQSSNTTNPSNPSKSRRASEYDAKSRNNQQILDVRLSELDEKWREVDEELETFRREVERGSETDRTLTRRCRMLPVQLDSIRQSLARSTAFTEQAKEFIDTLFASIDLQTHPPLQGHFQPSASAAGSTNADASESGKESKPLPGLFAALSLGSGSTGGAGAGGASGVAGVAGADSADLFRALAKNDLGGEGGGYVDGGSGDGYAGDMGGVVTAVQPATPRRIPGTPRRGGPDGNGGGGGGSALRRG